MAVMSTQLGGLLKVEDGPDDAERVEALGLVGAVVAAYFIASFTAKQILIFCYLFVGTCHWVSKLAIENGWGNPVVVSLVGLAYCAFNIHEAFLMKFLTENTYREERGVVVAI